LSFPHREELPPDLFSRLRLIYCGAEPIRRQTIDSFIRTAIPLGLDPQSLFFCYGLAEATLVVTGQHLDTMEESFDSRPASRPVARVGPALGDVEIRICELDGSDSDKLCPDKREGAIYLRGSSIFRGYWKGEQFAENSWFRTGDIGYLRDGKLYVSGREKEMMIVNGENIFPNDIENALSSIPDIREALAMFEDEQLYLLIIPTPLSDVRIEAISSFICANFGISPRAVVQATPNQIVRTTSGKPMRYETLAAARKSGLLAE
jgi:fatty-acyl-CoA synthase